MSTPEEVKLYFEEIPATKDDDENDSNGVSVSNLSNGISSIEIQGGGCLQDINFGDDIEADTTKSAGQVQSIKFNVRCTVLNESNEIKPRGSFALNYVDSALYLFGGASRDGEHYGDLFKYNFSSSKWNNLVGKGNGPSSRSGHSSICFQERYLVIFGGVNFKTCEIYNDIHIFDIKQEKWLVNLQDFEVDGNAVPQPRTEHSATLYGNYMLLFGGSSPNVGPLNDLHVLDLSELSNTTSKRKLIWTQLRCKGAAPIPREMHTAVVYNPKFTKCCHVESKRSNSTQFPPDMLFQLKSKVVSDSIKAESMAIRDTANQHFKSKEFLQAEELYSKAIELDPAQHLFYGNRSATRLLLGKLSEGLEDALMCTRLSPLWAKGYYREACCHMKLGQSHMALNSLQLAIQLTTEDAEREQYVKLLEAIKVPEAPVDATPLEGDVLVVYGGRNTSRILSDVNLLELSTLTWRKVRHTSFYRCGHSCSLSHDGKLHFFGGLDENQVIHDSSLVYDLHSEMWTETDMLPSAPKERFSHRSVDLCGCDDRLLEASSEADGSRSKRQQTAHQVAKPSPHGMDDRPPHTKLLVCGGINLKNDLSDLVELEIGDDL